MKVEFRMVQWANTDEQRTHKKGPGCCMQFSKMSDVYSQVLNVWRKASVSTAVACFSVVFGCVARHLSMASFCCYAVCRCSVLLLLLRSGRLLFLLINVLKDLDRGELFTDKGLFSGRSGAGRGFSSPAVAIEWRMKGPAGRGPLAELP